MPPSAAAQDDQTLPSKEGAMFKQVIRMYENKQYKSALKNCNNILKKFPNHGETLSMKGLTLSNIEGHKTEAYDFVKLGLTKSKCKSHICWHVYGLLHRGDKNYEQAIKCYRNALHIEPDNVQILRDLALLQVQCMETAGLVGTRHKLLELKPSQKVNWLGFALAHYLNKNFTTTLNVLDTFDVTILEERGNTYEESELLLFRNMVLFESGDYTACLDHLDDCKGKIIDDTATLEVKAKCYRALGRTTEAQATYLDLLRRNPEHRHYLLSYVQGEGHALQDWEEPHTAEEAAAVLATVDAVAAKLPQSHSLRRVALGLARGDDFRTRLIEFTIPYLKKTIPSLSSALKSLYRCPEKVAIMGELFSQWEEALKTDSKFPGEEEPVAPSTQLWLLMLLSAHQYRIANYEGALRYVDAAIEHTPTVEMLYILKARILKHLGDLGTACAMVEKARLLDTADRFLNTKVAKYMLRTNQIKEAERITSLFTSPSGEGPGYRAIMDMQCMWYELEEGDAYHRLGDLITAMKKWLLIDKHFQDMEEDQFDFHLYCLRKFTLRAYVDLLRFERRSHGHRFYLAAAQRVVKGYLEIHAAKQRGEDLTAKVLHLNRPKEGEPNGAEAAGAKKGDAKKKKKDGKKPEEEEEEEENPQAAKEKEFDLPVNTEDPLGAAIPFLKTLVQYQGQSPAGWLLGAELYLRRGKPALVAQHLLGARRAAPDSPDILPLATELFKRVAEDEAFPPMVRAVVEGYRPLLLPP